MNRPDVSWKDAAIPTASIRQSKPRKRVKVEAATQTFATITLQNYFRMYHKLAGMTGTAETEAGEFWDIYKLDVVTIPTNRPVARHDMTGPACSRPRSEKYAAVIDEIAAACRRRAPRTRRHHIRRNLRASQPNARPCAISPTMSSTPSSTRKKPTSWPRQAAPEPVTIATNMAGRGTDIKLPVEVKEAGGLAIIGTERHESRRVDRQLRGRVGTSGRSGFIACSIVSFEDRADASLRLPTRSSTRCSTKFGIEGRRDDRDRR